MQNIAIEIFLKGLVKGFNARCGLWYWFEPPTLSTGRDKFLVLMKFVMRVYWA